MIQCICGYGMTKLAEGDISDFWLCEGCGRLMVAIHGTTGRYWYEADFLEGDRSK